MFLGHFAVAFVLWALAPSVPPIVALVGVSFPDLLFGLLFVAGVESVEPSADSPLWGDIEFPAYPYSHSLVVGTLLAAVPGVLLAVWLSPLAGVVFVAASVSHWVFDVLVHRPDVPVLGFGDDRTIGLGLWNYPRVWFVVEFALYAGAAWLFLPAEYLTVALVVGAVFHLLTVNHSFGLTDGNPVASTSLFAGEILSGYAGIVFALWYLL